MLFIGWPALNPGDTTEDDTEQEHAEEGSCGGTGHVEEQGEHTSHGFGFRVAKPKEVAALGAPTTQKDTGEHGD